MATNIEEILARARIIAIGVGGDQTLSPVVDNKAAFRALLDTALSSVIIRRAGDKKYWRDVAIRHTITVTNGVGTLPAGVIREFMHTADFSNSDNDLISYITFGIDDNELFDTYLGYTKIVGDTIQYTAPNTDFGDYTGTLYMTVPSVPEYPADPADDIPMTNEVFDDLCSTLALMIRGNKPQNS